jgi:hypothetical protein
MTHVYKPTPAEAELQLKIDEKMRDYLNARNRDFAQAERLYAELQKLTAQSNRAGRGGPNL